MLIVFVIDESRNLRMIPILCVMLVPHLIGDGVAVVRT